MVVPQSQEKLEDRRVRSMLGTGEEKPINQTNKKEKKVMLTKNELFGALDCVFFFSSPSVAAQYLTHKYPRSAK